MQAPLISVIIPYYNSRNTLEEAIRSILSQSFQRWELLLVNDGSTDDSAQLALQFTDERIRHLGWKENKGKSSARNAGWEIAAGKYIAFLDADDISFPQRFQKQFDYLEQHPGIGILGSAYLELGSRKRTRVFPWRSEYLAAALLFKNLLIQSGVMLRRDLSPNLRYNKDFERYGQDYKLWWDALVAGTGIANLPDVLLAHRPGGSSEDWQNQPEIKEQRLQFFLERLSWFGIQPKPDNAAFILDAFRGRIIMNREQVQLLKQFCEELLHQNQALQRVNQAQLKALLCYHWIRWCWYRETSAGLSDWPWMFSRLGVPAFLRFFYWQNALFLEQLG